MQSLAQWVSWCTQQLRKAPHTLSMYTAYGLLLALSLDHPYMLPLQITNEMLAAIKLPVHPLLAPCLLFGGSNTDGFCLSSYGGETLEQLQEHLQEFEQLIEGFDSDLRPEIYKDMMQQLQEKRVQLFLCLLVCMLLAIETFQCPVSPSCSKTTTEGSAAS
jgi:hypothetical protein